MRFRSTFYATACACGPLSGLVPTVEMSPAGRMTCDSLGTAIATAGPDFGRPTTAIWFPWDVGIIHTTLGGAAPRLPATRGRSFPPAPGRATYTAAASRA